MDVADCPRIEVPSATSVAFYKGYVIPDADGRWVCRKRIDL